MKRYLDEKKLHFVIGSALIRSALSVFVAWLAVVFVLVTCASPALADDYKSYPGSMCVRWSGTSTPHYMNSAIGNPSSTQWLHVDCPIIKDNVTGSKKIGYAKVRTVDESPDGIRCTLHSKKYTWGWHGYWNGPRYSSGPSGYSYILFEYGVASWRDYHSYLSCSIPPTHNGKISYIVNYENNEYD